MNKKHENTLHKKPLNSHDEKKLRLLLREPSRTFYLVQCGFRAWHYRFVALEERIELLRIQNSGEEKRALKLGTEINADSKRNI